MTSPWVPAGERVLLACRPGGAFIVLRSWRLVAILALVGVAAVAFVRMYPGLLDWTQLVLALAATALLRIAWATVDLACRSYILTDKRILRVRGILNRDVADLPLDRIQNIALTRSIGERLFGVGTLGFATAGTAAIEAYWVMVEHPAVVLKKIRDVLDDHAPNDLAPTKPERRRPIVVIGLAGGIGSGKSTVAAEFEKLGCVVADSDRESRAALDLPAVKERLTAWWGPGILTADGRVDRSAVARIVFADPTERARLEGLVHPIVRASRASLLERARAAGAPAVIVDAPLLFEAGLDKDCDAVVFVDAPREARLERVRARGWDESEVDRREKAQWTVEEKRRRSHYTIDNSGNREQLGGVVANILKSVRGNAEGKVLPGSRA